MPAGALAAAKPTAEGGAGGWQEGAEPVFPLQGFGSATSTPPGIRESGWEAESRSHSLEPPVSFQCGNFDWPEIQGQVLVSKAMEVARGCVRAGPGSGLGVDTALPHPEGRGRALSGWPCSRPGRSS